MEKSLLALGSSVDSRARPRPSPRSPFFGRSTSSPASASAKRTADGGLRGQPHRVPRVRGPGQRLRRHFRVRTPVPPDSGTLGTGQTPNTPTSTRFWEGFSFVGLRTPFGAVTAGRQYTSAFLTVQNQVDVFAGERSRPCATMHGNNTIITPQGVGQVRWPTPSSTPSPPPASSLGRHRRSHRPGPSVPRWRPPTRRPGLGGSLLREPHRRKRQHRERGRAVHLRAGHAVRGTGNGDTNTNLKVKSFLVGANIAVGTGDIKLGTRA